MDYIKDFLESNFFATIIGGFLAAILGYLTQIIHSNISEKRRVKKSAKLVLFDVERIMKEINSIKTTINFFDYSILFSIYRNSSDKLKPCTNWKEKFEIIIPYLNSTAIRTLYDFYGILENLYDSMQNNDQKMWKRSMERIFSENGIIFFPEFKKYKLKNLKDDLEYLLKEGKQGNSTKKAEKEHLRKKKLFDEKYREYHKRQRKIGAVKREKPCIL